MRKFIISDIHGYGNLYYSVMGYLDNISKNEEIELYINGDLIDRGYESAEILLDVIKRIKENKFKIVYLGGNHELMMYQEYEERKKKDHTYYNNWYYNGGYMTDDGLHEILHDDNKINSVVSFISNLKIYHSFNEKIGNKRILLVHAASPSKVLEECDLKIKDDNDEITKCVWLRDDFPFNISGDKVGNKDYFTIIGHTPNYCNTGYIYNKKNNYLNIDGGVAFYLNGSFKYNHYPLVEICDDYLKILTFNGNNSIIHGNYFYDNMSFPFSKSELKKEKELLSNSVKIKKLSINSDGIVGYWK